MGKSSKFYYSSISSFKVEVVGREFSKEFYRKVAYTLLNKKLEENYLNGYCF
jgi:hypothetical protein